MRAKGTLLLIVFLLLLPNLSFAWKDDWSKVDTLREIAWQGIHIIDWGQTLDAANHPDKYHELNPILGRHPSSETVSLYMGLSAIAHPVISYILPKKYRVWWQWITIGTSSACVINNFSIGLKVKF